MDKFKMGVSVFFDQAINISGGINPKIVSEIKKTEITVILEKVYVKFRKPSFIL